MIIEDYLRELSSDEVAQVKQVLSESHLYGKFIKKTFENRRFRVIRHLNNFFVGNKRIEEILIGIKVDEELRRIRNGCECAMNLPKKYLMAISDSFGEWGVVSFYRGRWEIENPDLSEDLSRISMRHIYAGSEILKKKLKKDFMNEKTFFALESSQDRIKNSYDAIFNLRFLKQPNYYELEALEEEKRRFV